MGNSSNVNITGWIVYLSGALGDTGRVIVDELAAYNAFTADVIPEGTLRHAAKLRLLFIFTIQKAATFAGFLVPASTVDVAGYINNATIAWKQKGCPLEAGDASLPRYPLLKLARTISIWTNAFYGKNVRTCAFERTTDLTASFSQELTCSYDDLDLAVVVRLKDGSRFLENLRYAPPPPAPPPAPPPSPSPPQTPPPHQPAPLHPPPMTWSSSPPRPPPEAAQESPATSQGIGGCFLTSLDCGDHGTLKTLSLSGCTCVCDPGWRNAGQQTAQKYYCSGEFVSTRIERVATSHNALQFRAALQNSQALVCRLHLFHKVLNFGEILPHPRHHLPRPMHRNRGGSAWARVAGWD